MMAMGLMVFGRVTFVMVSGVASRRSVAVDWAGAGEGGSKVVVGANGTVEMERGAEVVNSVVMGFFDVDS